MCNFCILFFFCLVYGETLNYNGGKGTTGGSEEENFFETVGTIGEGQGFSMYGRCHLLWLLAFAVTAVFLAITYRSADVKSRRKLRILIAILLVADELFKQVILVWKGLFTLSYLPLHLCSINIFLIVIHAIHPYRFLSKFLYLVCLPAALAALLFPSWTQLPFANFMHLHSFTVHILLAVYPIMLTAGGEAQARAKDLPGCLVLMLSLAIPVYLFNLEFGTNFMFLMRADSGNPLCWFEETFGNHLIGIPVIAAGVFVLLLLPPALLRRYRSHHRMPQHS